LIFFISTKLDFNNAIVNSASANELRKPANNEQWGGDMIPNLTNITMLLLFIILFKFTISTT